MASGKPEAYRFVPQIEDVRVTTECACGCARIYFIDEPEGKVMILANRAFDRPDGGSTHCYVFAVGEVLGGLDLMHYDRFGSLEESSNEAFVRKADLEL